MQKLFNMASLSLLWLVFFNFSTKSEVAPILYSESVTSAETLSLALACQDTINVTLDPNCQFELTTQALFSSALPDCLAPEDFQIVVDDPIVSNGNLVDECGFWQYYIGLLAPNDCTTFTSCWGVIRAEDKTPPEIRLPDNQRFLLSCLDQDTILNNPASLALTGIAETRDNCGPSWEPLRDFNDKIVNNNLCDDLEILRTFFTEDEKGNRAQAVQTIILTRPTLDLIDIAPSFELDTVCTYVATLTKDDAGNIHPSVSGYPSFINEFGERTELDEAICGLAVHYEDRRFDVCEAAFKIERTWTVSDWCSGSEKILRQLIKIGDLQGPELNFPQETYQTSTGPFACEGAIEAIAPQVSDICSAVSTQVELYRIAEDFLGRRDTVITQSLLLTNENRLFTPEPVGDYLLVYTVRDACKNTTIDTLKATIIDQVKPIAKCVDALNVTLNNFGFAQVSYLDIDEGSSDNCALDSLQIRRLFTKDDDCNPLSEPKYSDWGEQAFFFCCDLHEQVEVALRVVDKSGNESQCWANVLIEDKEIPTCQAPADITIDCDSLSPGFDYNDPIQLALVFGTATGVDACSPTTVEELIIKNELSQCGFGELIRSFVVYDELGRASTNVCEQVITVEAVHNYEIKFPLDYSTVCAEPEPDSLLVTSYGCDLLAVFSDDTRLTAAGEECFKIFRKYRVINWCEYDGLADAYVVPRDIDCDDKPGDEDIYVLVRPDGKVYFDANNDETDDFPARDSINYNCFGLDNGNPEGYWVGTDSVPDIQSRGFWEYTQIIKVQDTIAPTIVIEDTVSFCINRPNCEAEVVVSFAIIDECVEGNVTIRTFIEEAGPAREFVEYDEDPWGIVGRYPKYLMSGIIPEGNYRVEIESDDQCGNVTRVAYTLEVVDCKPPPLICHDGMVVELMGTAPGSDADGDGDVDAGANTVWATDFIASVVADDCNGPVDYSINRTGEQPDRSQKALILTCDDPEVLDVEIYAWDNADNPFSVQPDGQAGGPNFDFCNNFIEIQDNRGVCEPLGDLEIAGKIVDSKGGAMPDIEVRLSGASTRLSRTNSAGDYAINGLIEGHDYSLFPQKSTDLMQGVSTLDIIYITKHILGVQPFEDAYQYIAADINRSSSISTLDIILLRKAILRIDQAAIDQVGWRFIDADHQFSQLKNPWDQNIPEIISLNNIAFDQGDLDFIGVKLGDVSGQLKPRSQAKQVTYLEMKDALLEAGTNVRIPLNWTDANLMEGLQFGMQINPELATVLKIEEVSVGKENLNWSANQQQLLLSWDHYQKEQPIIYDQPLFYLNLAIKQTARLSEIISIDARLLEAEAYQNGQIKPIELKWEKENSPQAIVFPNPFHRELNVTLDQGWSQVDPIRIQLFSIEGKLILQKIMPAQNWDNTTLNLQVEENLHQGIYMLRVHQNHKNLNFKVLR